MKRPTFSDEELHTLQRNTFNYFWQETNPRNGLLADNTSGHAPASIRAAQAPRKTLEITGNSPLADVLLV